MAITITPKITGQQATLAATYAYLYEPLEIDLQHPGSGGYDYRIDLTAYDAEDTSIPVDYVESYAELDEDKNASAELDYMSLMRQYTQKEWFKIGKPSDIDWKSIIAPYLIQLDAAYYVNLESTNHIQIIGGRGFNDFVAAVDETQALTEWEVAGETPPDFIGYPKVEVTLADPTIIDIRPTVTVSTPTSGKDVCGGYLMWKSKYGGWCHYGFSIMSEVKTKQYGGNLDIKTFSSVNGNPFMETNYTKVSSTRTVNLRSIGLDKTTLEIVRDSLQESPAIYLYDNVNDRLELMKTNAVTGATNNLAQGGDIDISLSAIDTLTQNVR